MLSARDSKQGDFVTESLRPDGSRRVTCGGVGMCAGTKVIPSPASAIFTSTASFDAR